MEININGFSYYFENDEKLDEKEFINRCWYIAKNNPSNPDNYEKLKKYSRIWYNMNVLKCRYSPEIEKIVQKYS